MAKAFYGVDHQGKLLIERRSGDPTAELGRLYVDTAANKLKVCADGSNNRLVAIADGGSYNISADAAKYS